MKVKDKNIVITGGASGIGKELAIRFRAEGAAGITVSDIQADALQDVARQVDGLAVVGDASKESDILSLVKAAEEAYGPIDVFCSNAGIIRKGWEETPDDIWQLNWDLHVMSHVFAARAVIPGMLARGSGYLINTASAAGLLSQIDSATYSVSKHAAVAFAETLSIRYGDKGIGVSVLCPQSVRTGMTAGREGSPAAVDGMMEASELADCVIETIDREEFLILPHVTVREYIQRKSSDYDRWLKGMRRLRDRFLGSGDS
jgi:NAD(P)-dependent dehydrogenase (short-subunit alcohol dehydrogenase family)